MPEDLTPIERFALVLLRHFAFEDDGRLRSWRGYEWELMNRLHARGFISDPTTRAKSVVFTEEGRRLADELVATLVGPDSSGSSVEDCNCGCMEGIPGGGFLPGHDEELRDRLESRVGGLLALSALVRAAESYVHGELTPVELAKDVRGRPA